MVDELDLTSETIDIWRLSDYILDKRANVSEELRSEVDEVHKELHIQPEGPSIVLSKRAKEILEKLNAIETL